MGYAVPAGTIVSTQAWSMHRDASVFPSPETFLPERWLPVEGVEGEEERLALYVSSCSMPSLQELIACYRRMTQHMMPFGVGSRICGGHALAQLVMRMVVAAVARNLSISADVTQTNERSMEMRDAFVGRHLSYVFYGAEPSQVLFPASKECKLSFDTRRN